MRTPTLLEIAVVEGEGEIFATGSRAYRGISVQVVDETGAPARGARVAFRLPRSGPSGRFASGGLEEQAWTDGEGRASAWGIQWNDTAGDCPVVVVATAGTAHAGTTVRVVLTGSAAPAPRPAVPSYEVAPAPRKEDRSVPPDEPVEDAPGEQRAGVLLTRTENLNEDIPNPRNKWLLITLAIGAAVGGGFAYRMSRAGGGTGGAAVTPSALNPPPRPSIGNPSITISRP